MNTPYAHLGLDDILLAYRMLQPAPDNPSELAELLGKHLMKGGWPGVVVRCYFDLAFHDATGRQTFLELDGKTVDLTGDTQDEVHDHLVANGTMYRWSAIRRFQAGDLLDDSPTTGVQANLDALIGHIDEHLSLQEATLPAGVAASRPRARM